MEFEATFGTAAPLLGMVHLPALPGAPQSGGDLGAVVERAVADARALEAGGVDGVVVENYGDAPFYPESVPDHTVAAMTRVATAVDDAIGLPLGINVLRNDATAALSVAHAVGAAFVRVNVHVGARVTDQGVVEGQAHETLRLRDRLDAETAIFADLGVKHSAPLGGDERVSVPDLVERGLADAVLVSGPATGAATAAETLDAVVAERDAADLDTPVLAASGVDADSVGRVLDVADGAIVGTALKRDGETTAPVDPDRVAALVAAADQHR